MEQRIGPYIQPVQTAGTDPAHVPGFPSSRPAEAEETAPGKAAEQPPEDVVVPPDDPEEAAGSGEEGEQEIDGPVFEVSDRRGSITADRTGVRFTLDGEEAEFGWDEIGAVEVDAARFGRRFTVTVYMTTRRWYSAEVTAPAKSHLKEWAAELDVALDAYFEQTEL
ncbi:hypothetical protein [Actinacidiphila oryziradicis]|uniref:Uncharacterized protein n=1 Tax=Actinacidiphila oryziradicis TaxID=2571141 RepID=A0A4U0SJE0_9ACTN|nr:hypothetical protein [Actinacidiphila oryziradicis]TKA08171.1 hypothetical protein FCI23_29260 [Actinacidiphila oryziradicis]